MLWLLKYQVTKEHQPAFLKIRKKEGKGEETGKKGGKEEELREGWIHKPVY